ncbi:MAG TPA: tetratricopeptide repeat protein [Roseateles sp.]|uniref:tetratricopeptide repeat protein n=1 Tax=Roseateles sp. TaxID=1971397 RepID=UPI002EDAC481
MKTLSASFAPLWALAGASLLACAGAARAASHDGLEALLKAQRFRQAAPLMRPLLEKTRPDVAERELVYRWLFAVDDGAGLERRLDARLSGPPAGIATVDLLAAARQAQGCKKLDLARELYARAGGLARTPQQRAQVLRGQGQLAHELRDYEGSLRLLDEARRLDATPDVLVSQADTLIRLGRTNDAVDALLQAVRLSPYHELANYQLGNGYARANYTELAQRCGPAFLRAATATRLASDAFEAGQLDDARNRADAARAACPGYGRAHAVLAKVAESERLAVNVHRAAAEARFAATPMPEVPQIEQYVVNWSSLTERHRKRVALSVAPWKAYIPVLVAGGASHFIKPLYMRLSETPGASGMRDTRIDYDSRLWDDVRGMGGHMTVTGIEDVERSIAWGYNTVLHELSHQVHGVMTDAQKREIQELYRQAKTRDAQTGQAFLSRYAGGSIWEYFAEGANSQDTPRRDAYDQREIVRERLVAMDPALQALVLRFTAQSDVQASLPVALVNASWRYFETGELQPGLDLLSRALVLAPDDAQVLAANLHGLSLRGQGGQVEALAERAERLHPDDGALRVAVAEARRHAGQPLGPLVERLGAGREALPADDRLAVEMALGGYALEAGRADAALAAYEQALSYQGDDPAALWGKAAALALAKRWEPAFASYRQAIKLRTGLLPLRLGLARDLLLAGRTAEADQQLGEAQTLQPQDAELMALRAWVALAQGRAEAALALADGALKAAPWSDTSVVMRAAALRALLRGDEARALQSRLDQALSPAGAPRYVYRAETRRWTSIGRDVATLRRVAAAVDGLAR